MREPNVCVSSSFSVLTGAQTLVIVVQHHSILLPDYIREWWGHMKYIARNIIAPLKIRAILDLISYRYLIIIVLEIP